MLSKSLRQLILCRLREFRREPSAMIFVISMPIIWMLILGLAFSGDRKETYRVGILHSVEASIKEALKGEEFLLTEGSDTDLYGLLKSGKVELLVANTNEGVNYVFDPSSPSARRARNHIDLVIQAKHGQQPVVANQDTFYNKQGGRYIDFLIPGLIALSLFTTSLFGTGMTIVVNRRENLLKRYIATPMRPYEYLLSHVIGRVLVMFLEIGSILSFGYLFFSFRVEGNFLWFLAISSVSTVCFAAIAILFGSRFANTSTYNGISNLVMLLMMLFSGIWFSRDYFPKVLGDIASYLPLSACVDSLRMLSVGIYDTQVLLVNVLVLCGYTIGSLLLARKLFVWQS